MPGNINPARELHRTLSVRNSARDYFVPGICKRHFLTRQIAIVLDHHPDQLPERHLRLPSELLSSLSCISHQVINLGRAEIACIGLDVLSPVEATILAGDIQKFTD